MENKELFKLLITTLGKKGKDNENNEAIVLKLPHKVYIGDAESETDALYFSEEHNYVYFYDSYDEDVSIKDFLEDETDEAFTLIFQDLMSKLKREIKEGNGEIKGEIKGKLKSEKTKSGKSVKKSSK